MLRYVLQRVLLLLPSLWILCSVVFFLSKTIPGTCLDWQLGEADQMGNNLVTPRANKELNIPLFYFSVQSKAEPDTLYRIQPSAHQKFLKNLALTYGNWSAITALYHTLTGLQQELPSIFRKSPVQAQQLKQQLEAIFTHSEVKSIVQQLQIIESLAWQQKLPAIFIIKVELGLQQVKNLTPPALPINVLIPAVIWHGADNQYHTWLKAFLRGDLGVSCRNQEPVNQNIAEAFANTFVITVLSISLIFFLALELSIWLSKATGNKWRKMALSLLYALDSVPVFIIALILITLFASTTYVNILPVYGLGRNVAEDAPIYLRWVYQLPHFIMPVITLTLAHLPSVTGQTYQAMQQLQHRDFILTAKAKGLSERVVLRRHLLRNALLPVITLFTGFLPALVTGAVVIEVIYAIPGMGRLLRDAVMARDFPVLIGIVLYLGLIKMAAHLLADVCYYLADPRIRVQA